MMKNILGILIILSVFAFSCKTDFDVNADYKDITLVYGLLDQHDSVHYIKINKAFLGNASAYDMAAVSDSVNYTNAIVYLMPIKDGVEGTKIKFDTTTSIQKLPGTFATDKNYIYKSTATLNQDYSYKLMIDIGTKHISSQTTLIQDFYVVKPASYQNVSFENYKIPYPVEWKSAKNGKIYELTLRLHYWEEDHNNGNAITEHAVDWVLPSKVANSSDGGETMKLDISCENFYSQIASAIEPKPGVVRIVKKASIDFLFLVGGDALNTYIEVSQPSNGLVQDKPAYTNIDNGIGIFSCRLHYNSTDKPGLYGKRISDGTIDTLAQGQFTKTLGFLNANETTDYWSINPWSK